MALRFQPDIQAESARGLNTIVDHTKAASKIGQPIQTFIKDYNAYQGKIKEQATLDENQIMEMANKASLSDARIMDEKIKSIRNWETDMIDKGFSNQSSKYRNARREKIYDLSTSAVRSQKSDEVWKSGLDLIEKATYMKDKDQARQEMYDSIWGTEINKRNLKGALNIVSDDKYFDMNQLLIDQSDIFNKNQIIDSKMEFTKDGKWVINKTTKHSPMVHRYNPDTGEYDVKMDDAFFDELIAVDERVEGSLERWTENWAETAQNIINDPDSSPEAFKRAKQYQSGTTREKAKAALEHFMSRRVGKEQKDSFKQYVDYNSRWSAGYKGDVKDQEAIGNIADAIQNRNATGNVFGRWSKSGSMGGFDIEYSEDKKTAIITWKEKGMAGYGIGKGGKIRKVVSLDDRAEIIRIIQGIAKGGIIQSEEGVDLAEERQELEKIVY